MNDEVFFVGTGVVHLYYFLRVVLSSEKTVKDFTLLQSDFPILSNDEELIKTNYCQKNHQTQFAIFDFDKDGTKDIFIRLDNSSFLTSQTLKRKGIKTNQIVLTFRNGKALFRDFESIK